MAVESGAGAEVGNATVSLATALFPFVSTVFSFSVFSSAFFPSFSTDSTGFLSSVDSSLVGVLLFVSGSLLELAAVGGVCLRVEGGLGVCCVVLTSVSLLTLLGSFSGSGCEPPLLLPPLPLVNGGERPLCFFNGLMSSSLFTKCRFCGAPLPSLLRHSFYVFLCFFFCAVPLSSVQQAGKEEGDAEDRWSFIIFVIKKLLRIKMTSYLEVCYTALAITLAQNLTYALIQPSMSA